MWEHLDHLAIVLGLVGFFTPPLWWAIRKIIRLTKQMIIVAEVAKQSDADHKKIIALWNDLEYGDWNGVERRRNKREDWNK